MWYHNPSYVSFCPQQKAATRASTTSTPRSAQRATSQKQAVSPTSELAAQLEDLVFSGQQTPGTPLLSTASQHPTTTATHTRTLRSKRQMSQTKDKEKNSCVLSGGNRLGKDESNRCGTGSDSAGSGRQVVVASSPFTDELLCREAELAVLEAFLQEHVCGRKAGSLYVSGPPGTGKSASINHLLESRPVSLCVGEGGGREWGG